MKAMLMAAPGGPEVMQIADLPLPELPSPAHLLVRLKAAGVTQSTPSCARTAPTFPTSCPRCSAATAPAWWRAQARS